MTHKWIGGPSYPQYCQDCGCNYRNGPETECPAAAANIPPPPDGYPSWLDCTLATMAHSSGVHAKELDMFARIGPLYGKQVEYARAELEALRATLRSVEEAFELIETPPLGGSEGGARALNEGHQKLAQGVLARLRAVRAIPARVGGGR